MCHDPGMAHEKPKDPPEGRFAEAMRKSKEKRAGMQRPAENRASFEEESRDRQDTSVADRAAEIIKDSET